MSWKKLPFIFDNNALSYFKCNDLLHTLNVYKTAAKKHLVVDSWAADKISVS